MKKQTFLQWLGWSGPSTPKPTISAAEQTRLSWARAIRSYDAVPEVFKPFFTPGQAWPYCVLTPSYEGFMVRATEKLVCDLGDELCILEKSGASYTTQHFALAGINYVEVRTILLDSQIKISGVTQPGGPAVCTMRFNTVTDYLFTPLLDKIRSLAVGARQAIERSELEKFDAWSETSFKFMNYARGSLLGQETVLQAVLQPEILAPRFKILGLTFYKTLAPTHASLLTDRELILIREEPLQSNAGKYGGIWDYIPLEKIDGLALRAGADADLWVFSIQLPENERLERLLQSKHRSEVVQLLEHFHALTGKSISM
jgi:hypothetical protein